jgi:zinc transport system substrate-binding protein
VWLDPVLMGRMATTVADTLSASDPDNAATFDANAKALQEQLAGLDADWSDGTASCQIPTMVVSHEAFGYLAAQYGFEQKGIAGLSPETEPSAQAIADLATFVKDNGVTTVYTETLVDPAVAQTVASEAGVTTATLDPLEGPPATGDYISAMQENLAAVQEGQDCS